LLQFEGDEPEVVELSADKKRLEGEGVDAFRTETGEIDAGIILGEHTISIAKVLGTPDDFHSIALEISFARTSHEGAQPTTTVDLRYVRHHGQEDSMVVQARRIELDPNSNELRVGDTLAGMQWAERESFDPTDNGPKEYLVTDPFPEDTAATLQGRYTPVTPLDRPLNSADWQQLMLGPLETHDMIKPR
jgi:hypothetical protein